MNGVGYGSAGRIIELRDEILRIANRANKARGNVGSLFFVVENMKSSPGVCLVIDNIEKEFQELAKVLYNPQYYPDLFGGRGICPYSHNVFETPSDLGVNASWMSDKMLVAASPPFAENYWNMVDTSNAAVIVMSSGEGSIRYFPGLEEPLRLSEREISLTQQRAYTMPSGRKLMESYFHIKTGGKDKLVHHFELVGYEDYDSIEPHDLLYLFSEHTCPKEGDNTILYHCKTGLGVSAVLAICDYIYHWDKEFIFKDQKAFVDVPILVKGFREQRFGMVRTKSQFEAIYNFVSLVANMRN